jgi:hypothetical protein
MQTWKKYHKANICIQLLTINIMGSLWLVVANNFWKHVPYDYGVVSTTVSLCVLEVVQSINQCPSATLKVHRPPTRALQASLSCASCSNSPHDRLISLTSDSTLLCHVILGLPLLLFSCGFHVIACLVTLAVVFLNVCPNHCHFLWRISSLTAIRLCFHSSRLLILFGHWIFNIHLRQLLAKVCIFSRCVPVCRSDWWGKIVGTAFHFNFLF